MLRITRNLASTVVATNKFTFAPRAFGTSSFVSKGFEDFYDQLKPDEVMTAGRAWTAADLRKKVNYCTRFNLVVVIIFIVIFSCFIFLL